ncbi:hypothetical protein [Agriterribacter sp.]|uniref:hypothetical protein n=1 Tax=Agriterribacter sp. TaxID=2821509 RepID=UPI002BE0A3BD|nr:hypothetical protein [Agriterribacter sp.]HRP55228.1 hypothetical protein [Agriterribacter sp.]
MNQYEQLIQTLSQYPSRQWVNDYFDLQKQLLTDFQIENDNPRLALSLTTDGKMPVNIGQRYVLKPVTGGRIRAIAPLNFDEAAIAGKCCFLFRKNRMPDAKWIEIKVDENSVFPDILYRACVQETEKILQHCRKSGYRKYHVELLYYFTMEQEVRDEILDEVNWTRLPER